VEVRQTRLLLDCGFGVRDVLRRLARLELEPSQLSGILVTHEHNDHTKGVFKLAARDNLPVYLTHGTLSALRHIIENASINLQIIDGHSAFAVGDIQIQPFPVPHDAREPVQYTFDNGHRKLGVLTDAGTTTPHIENMLSGCQALVLECNHDLDMLMHGNYHGSLKRRISSRYGHLDNAAAAALLANFDISKLQHLVAAHLSKNNNTAELVRKTLSDQIHCEEGWIGIAEQETGFGWRQIT